MSNRRSEFGKVVRRVHPYAWLWQPLETDPSFVLKAMFGAQAVYIDGKLVLCFSAHEEPWRGVLICTDRGHHESLTADFPSLSRHSILPKWLYLPESLIDFECVAQRVVGLVRARDFRIGITPKPKPRSKRTPRGKPRLKTPSGKKP